MLTPQIKSRSRTISSDTPLSDSRTGGYKETAGKPGKNLPRSKNSDCLIKKFQVFLVIGSNIMRPALALSLLLGGNVAAGSIKLRRADTYQVENPEPGPEPTPEPVRIFSTLASL